MVLFYTTTVEILGHVQNRAILDHRRAHFVPLGLITCHKVTLTACDREVVAVDDNLFIMESVHVLHAHLIGAQLLFKKTAFTISIVVVILVFCIALIVTIWW